MPTDETDPPDEERAPLSDLAEEVRSRRADADRRRDREPFSERDVPEIDAEDAWEALLADDAESAAREADDPPDAAPVATGEAAETPDDRDARVVEKGLCHGCPYFGAPPALHCTHEGTEIREVTDVERYLVVDCPMVVDDAGEAVDADGGNDAGAAAGRESADDAEGVD